MLKVTTRRTTGQKAKSIAAKLRTTRMRKVAELVEPDIAETLTYYAFRAALAPHLHQQPAQADRLNAG